MQREHDAGKPERAEPGADEVDSTADDRRRLRHDGKDQQDRPDHERDVQREDPPPRERVDDPTSCQWPDDRRDPAPGGPRPDRGTTLLRAERRDDDREGRRRQQRRRRALARPRCDQDLDRRRERAGHGEDAEARESQREDPPLTVDVAERAADQDQRAQGEQIGVRDPLLRGETTAEVALDRGQRDVDDRTVDRGDRRAQDRGEQRQSLPMAHAITLA